MALVVKRVLVWAIKSCTYENGPFYAENIQKLNFVTFFNEKQQSFICKLLFPNCWTQNIKRTKTNFYSSKFMLCIDDPRADSVKWSKLVVKLSLFIETFVRLFVLFWLNWQESCESFFNTVKLQNFVPFVYTQTSF